jgi:hypothetical protein
MDKIQNCVSYKTIPVEILTYEPALYEDTDVSDVHTSFLESKRMFLEMIISRHKTARRGNAGDCSNTPT